MRVTIDREECISCATCYAVCSEFFEPDPQDDRSQVVAKYRVEGNLAAGDAPDSLHDCVREAADACPVSVIHLESAECEHSYGP